MCRIYTVRLVFASDGIGVRVFIRRAEWYNLLKIKLTESEVELYNVSANDSVAYDLMKTRLSESHAEAK